MINIKETDSKRIEEKKNTNGQLNYQRKKMDGSKTLAQKIQILEAIPWISQTHQAEEKWINLEANKEKQSRGETIKPRQKNDYTYLGREMTKPKQSNG